MILLNSNLFIVLGVFKARGRVAKVHRLPELRAGTRSFTTDRQFRRKSSGGHIWTVVPTNQYNSCYKSADRCYGTHIISSLVISIECSGHTSSPSHKLLSRLETNRTRVAVASIWVPRYITRRSGLTSLIHQ